MRAFLNRLFRDRAQAAGVIMILLAPFVLLAPVLLKGQVLFWGTPGLQFVPWWWAAWQQLSQGILPLWNPLNGMGAPLLANYQMAFFYPPNWLLLPLAARFGPGGIAWGYTVLAGLHLGWGGLGMARFIRRLDHGWLAQVVGGLSFALGGYTVGRLGFFSMVWVMAWLPWMVGRADEAARSRSRWISLSPGLAGSTAMLLLAGHAQLAWYTLLLCGAWLIFSAWQEGGRRQLIQSAARFSLSAALGVCIAAVQLLPTLEYLMASHRASAVQYAETMRYSFWPWRFLTLFSPDFFGSPGGGDFWGYASYWEDHAYAGILPTLAAAASFYYLFKGLIKPAWRREHEQTWRRVLFLWVLLVVTFVLALGENTPVFPFLYRHFPTFNMFQAPARYLAWFAFTIPLLAAVGIDHWRSPAGRGLYWFRLGTAGAFALALGAGITWLTQPAINLTFIRSTAITGLWCLGVGLLTLSIPWMKRRNETNLWSGLVIAWTALDLLLAGIPLLPGTSPEFYKAGPKIVGPVIGAAGSGRLYISESQEYDLKFKRFFRFKDFTALEDWHNLTVTLLPNMNLLGDVEMINNFDPLVPGRYARWMEAVELLPPDARARALVMMDAGAAEQIDASQPGGVRFDPLAHGGRWRLAGCAMPVVDESEALQLVLARLKDQPGDSLASTAVIEDSSAAQTTCVPQSNYAYIQESVRTPTEIRLTVRSELGGWLVGAYTWYPGWQAAVDGQDVPVRHADYAFTGIHVEGGEHSVVLRYAPAGFAFGQMFSILGLFVWMSLNRMGALHKKP